MTVSRDNQQSTQPAPLRLTSLAKEAFEAFQTAGQGGSRHDARARAVEALVVDLEDPEQRDLGDFELLELIGRGGMGVVYRARQKSLERMVAVKILIDGFWAAPDFVARFRKEARAAARMQHPGIVEIYDTGECDGLHFIAMRLVEGKTLAQSLRESGTPQSLDAARLVRQIARAVEYAHSLGVLHLDLKPGNILLDRNGAALVADFGLARTVGDIPEDELGSETSGTPSYMAPEQALARTHPLGPATDVYGLGAILYECLTGLPPFLGATPEDTLNRVIHREVDPVRSVARSVPRDLAAVCDKCLQKHPAHRYPSAAALADDLSRFLEGHPVVARPLSPAKRLLRWVSREPAWASLTLAIFLGVLAATAFTATLWKQSESALSLAVDLLDASDSDNGSNDAIFALDRWAGGSTYTVSGKVETLKRLYRQLRQMGKSRQAARILGYRIFPNEAFEKAQFESGIESLSRSSETRVDQHRLHLLSKVSSFSSVLLDPANNVHADLLNKILEHVVSTSSSAGTLHTMAELCVERRLQIDPCRDGRLASRLGELDADNGSSWILAHRLLREDFSDQTLELAIVSVTHWNEFTRDTLEAALNSAPTVKAGDDGLRILGDILSDEERMIMSMAFLWAAKPHSSASFVSRKCIRDWSTHATTEQAAFCREMAAIMMPSTELFPAIVGASVAALHARGTELEREARDLKKQYVWTLEHNAMGAWSDLPKLKSFMADLLQDGELRAMIKYLEGYGVDSSSMRDWMPSDPKRLLFDHERTTP